LKKVGAQIHVRWIGKTFRSGTFLAEILEVKKTNATPPDALD